MKDLIKCLGSTDKLDCPWKKLCLRFDKKFDESSGEPFIQPFPGKIVGESQVLENFECDSYLSKKYIKKKNLDGSVGEVDLEADQ